MTVTEHEPVVPRALVARVKAILLKPAQEWSVIDGEPATIKGIYQGYLVYLAAIGPICSLIGAVVFFHLPIFYALASTVVGYLVSLAMCYAGALVISELAPKFGGEKNQIQGLKVTAYASTAAMVSGVFGIFPVLGILSLLGLLYSVYLLWLGLPKLMKIPEDKALTYFAVILGVGIVAAVLLFAVMGRVMMIGRYGG
jgi:hypothetical protein